MNFKKAGAAAPPHLMKQEIKKYGHISSDNNDRANSHYRMAVRR